MDWVTLRGMVMTNSNNQVSSENNFNALQQIQLELKAPKSKRNTFGNYNYRNCEDILEAVKPLLQKYNSTLVITDEVQEVAGVVIVSANVIFTDAFGTSTTVKAHAGVEINKKGMDVAQTFGASSSYARKYALNGMFLIDDTKDYDSDEYHHQINNGAAKEQKQQQNYESRQNNQASQKQQSNPTQKPKRSPDQLFQDALAAIKDAPDTTILDAAYKRFVGTTYEAGIRNACQARQDQMGWSAHNQPNQYQQNQAMHH